MPETFFLEQQINSRFKAFVLSLVVWNECIHAFTVVNTEHISVSAEI